MSIIKPTGENIPTTSKLTEHKTKDKKEILNELKKEFNVYGLPEEYAKDLKQEFVSLSKDLSKEEQEYLSNINLISATIPENEGSQPTDFYGFEVALDKLVDENALICIASVVPKDMLLHKKINARNYELAQLLFSHPRVNYIDLLMSKEDIIKSILEKNSIQEQSPELTDNFTTLLQSHVSQFMHDQKWKLDNLKKILEENHNSYNKTLSTLFNLPTSEKDPEIIRLEDNLLNLLYIFRPGSKNHSRESNLKRILAFYNREMGTGPNEGKRFEGVFVDYDYTLVDWDSKKINQDVLEKIKEYQKAGKEIIIWTGGELDIRQKELDAMGLDFKVVSKNDFRGATVEITIDDHDADDLYNNMRIKTEHHIQI